MKFTSKSSEETEEIGYKIGKMLKAGDIVRLYGDLGAGKTTLVKGIAGAFGIDKKDITSASYTIVAEYRTVPPFYHIDLYRVRDSEEIYNAGIWDVISRESVAVIEWAENIESELSEDTIKITITECGENTREITVEGINEEDRDNM